MKILKIALFSVLAFSAAAFGQTIELGQSVF